MSEPLPKPAIASQITVSFSGICSPLFEYFTGLIIFFETDITKNVLYISRGVELNQPRLIQRAVRQNASVRKYVTAEQLQILLKKHVPVTCITLQAMQELVQKIPSKVKEKF